MKYFNSDFNHRQLQFLYDNALHHEQMLRQWLRMGHYGSAAEYAAKLAALVELMEKITVANVGDGLDGFHNPRANHKSALERLHSFDKLFK